MNRLALAVACSLLVALGVGGCGKEEPAAPAAGNALTMTQSPDVSKQALEILNAKCTACHTAERFEARDFTPEEWSAVIDRMVGKGAKLSGDELDVLRHARPTP